MIVRLVSGLICRLTGQDGNEQVGDTGRAKFAETGKLLTIGVAGLRVKGQNAAAQALAFMNRPECARGIGLLRLRNQFHESRFELFHAATEHDAATLDEH